MLETLGRIAHHKIISIVRSVAAPDLEKTVETLYQGGIRVIEITMNTPDALSGIRVIKEKYPDMLVGAGTVLDSETARAAILSGAEFILAPNLSQSVIQLSNRYQILVIPGVFTPSEIIQAYEWGAPVVKIFPVSSLGPAYIKDLKGPFNHIKMIPVGGVSLDNAAEYLQSGAFALGVGSSLVDHKLMATKNYDELLERAKKFVNIANQY